jgi:hypothetical protein
MILSLRNMSGPGSETSGSHGFHQRPGKLYISFEAPGSLRSVTCVHRSVKKDLAKALRRSPSWPSFMPAPGFMVKLVLVEFGSVILEGQRVIPRRLLENGFVFQYPNIEKALQSIVG